VIGILFIYLFIFADCVGGEGGGLATLLYLIRDLRVIFDDLLCSSFFFFSGEGIGLDWI